MAQSNSITEAEVRDLATEQSFDRGYRYYRSNAVFKVPNWGILKCKRKAETIMDAGQAKYYETAVTWLSTARDIYQQHQWQQDWELYLDSVLEKHHRKYKLVPMLRNIRN